MPILFVIAGIVLGLSISHSMSGAVVGGVLGFILSEIQSLKRRVDKLASKGVVTPSRVEQTGWHQPPPADTTGVEEARAAEPMPAAKSVASSPPEPEVPVEEAHRPETVVASSPSISWDWLPGWITGGNTVVRVGVIVLFFGVAFLLKYAAEHTNVPIEFRLAGIGIGAIALLITGIWLRRRREGYGLSLEGGAIGILYLVVFAALRLYALLPAPFAFALLVTICALSAVLAVVQDSLALAVLGVAGGFLAPILTSTGGGSHVQLFSYYAVLNGGILAIAWFRSWRLLNLVGFAFTFVIGGIWGYQFYKPEFFSTTEPFLILFFLTYVAIAVLFALRRPPDLQDPVDAGLLFGVPIVAFSLQAALVRDYEYGLAWSALAAGALYLAIASALIRRGALRQLLEAFIALGSIFATLTIPFAFDNHWTTAAWAIEGAGMFWVGMRQDKLAARAFGLLLQAGAAVFYVMGQRTVGELAIVNSAYLGALLLSAAGMMTGLVVHRHRETLSPDERTIAVLALAWSVLWWYVGAFHEIHLFIIESFRVSVGLLVIAGSLLLAEGFGSRWHWHALRYVSALHSVYPPIALAVAFVLLDHPFSHYGFIAWPVAMLAHYWVLHRHERDQLAVAANVRHVALFWVVLALAALEVRWVVGEWLPESDWSAAAVGVLLASIVLLVHQLRDRLWPFASAVPAYLGPGLLPVVALSIAWILFVGIERPGHPAPLPYLPIFNPVDVAAMAILIALYFWTVAIRPLIHVRSGPANLAFGILAFGWANAVLFRSLHHYAELPYHLDGMLGSVLAQAAISIFWTSIALVLMLLAVRMRGRLIWVTGAILLGAVVVKLFIIDLSSTGTVARIVSFVVVGLLLLVIGYVTPVPPRATSASEVKS